MSVPAAASGPAGLLERRVGRMLFWGGVLGVAITVFGFVLYVAHGELSGQTLHLERATQHRGEGRPAAVFVSARAVVRGLARWPVDPVAVMTLGLLALAATPALGVLVALVTFVALRDRD